MNEIKPKSKQCRIKSSGKNISIVRSSSHSDTDFKAKISSEMQSRLQWWKDCTNTTDSMTRKQLNKDIKSILMNSQSHMRSMSIHRHEYMLKKKSQIFQSRGLADSKIFQLDSLNFRTARLNKRLSFNETRTNWRSQKYCDKIREQFQHKINEVNKIREQFMTIKAECPTCLCYNLESEVKDRNRQMMRTGSEWRISRVIDKQQTLQKLHSQQKILSQRSTQKYDHNQHMHKKRKQIQSRSQRKRSNLLI